MTRHIMWVFSQIVTLNGLVRSNPVCSPVVLAIVSLSRAHPSSLSQAGTPTHTLRLREMARGDDGEDVAWHWKRIGGQSRVFNDRASVGYSW